MRKDKSTHCLEMNKETKGGLRTANTDEGGQKHTLARDEETKGGLRTANTDEGGQMHTLPSDEKTKGGLRTANTGGEDRSTHSLEIRRQKRSEDSKPRWRRTKARTF